MCGVRVHGWGLFSEFFALGVFALGKAERSVGSRIFVDIELFRWGSIKRSTWMLAAI
jgi:hypothetical protein